MTIDAGRSCCIDFDTLRAALVFAVDYMRYHGGQEIAPEPHETVLTLGAVQEIELACVGCNATGVKRWRNNWKEEFTHESGCRWLAFVAACKDYGVDLPLRKSPGPT